MKRIIIILIAVVGIGLTTNAQVASNALGLRFGGGDGIGTAISYQHGLNDKNRLEFDLGLKSHNDYSAWALTGLYQWVWNIEGGFNWFAGAGSKIGSWSWDDDFTGDDDDGVFMTIAGDIGVEYAWPFGLQVALDLRPELGLINASGNREFDLALSLRYQF
jgi:opacity protein-like surface antigen